MAAVKIYIFFKCQYFDAVTYKLSKNAKLISNYMFLHMGNPIQPLKNVYHKYLYAKIQDGRRKSAFFSKLLFILFSHILKKSQNFLKECFLDGKFSGLSNGICYQWLLQR